MKEEISIIKVLLENKDKDLNISIISKLAKKDYKNTHNIVKRLEKKGIIKIEKFGKSSKINLVNNICPEIFEAECVRKNELLRNKNIYTMLNYFKRLSSKFYVLLIFGGYAKKKVTKHSDIDLMFIVPDLCEDKFDKEISSIVSLIPLDIHVHVFKEKDFIAMKDSKKFTVGSEAIINNIILYGIEDYYRLVQ